MNENLDLIKILKDCPKGTKLYSIVNGYVTFDYISISNYNEYPIVVSLNDDDGYESFTKDGKLYHNYDAECVLFPSKDNRDWSTFKVPNKLPKTWEEFCENHPIKNSEYYITSNGYISKSIRCDREDSYQNLLPNKETAEAMLALCQLIQLRDCYNDGWQPDWHDCNTKYTIGFFDGCMICNDNISDQKVLVFKTSKLRNEFFNNFKDLIEIAKPLL